MINQLNSKIELHNQNLVKNFHKKINRTDIADRLCNKFSIPSKLKPFCVSIILIDLKELIDREVYGKTQVLKFCHTEFVCPENYDLDKDNTLVSLRIFRVTKQVFNSLPARLKNLAVTRDGEIYTFNLALLAPKREH